jgi:adenine-specific DNA-methyltransferase
LILLIFKDIILVNLLNNDIKVKNSKKSIQNIDEQLNALLKKAKNSSFLSYRIDPHKFNGFDEFNISQKKEILKEIVDANTLYVNFTDIDDEDKNIAEIDKKLNEKFYREINNK